MIGIVLALGILGRPGSSPAQGKVDAPEHVIRAMVVAMYSNDVAGYNRVTLPHPMRARLTEGGQRNEEKLKALEEHPQGLQIIPQRPPVFRGEPVSADAKGDYPVGTSALYMVAHGGSPMVVTVVRRVDGWKVDLRWWIALMELASGREPAQDSPDTAIRSLLAAMLRLDREAASRHVATGADMELLFADAPRQREPSGVLDAAVFEMPLVEIEPGEFARTPGGKVVEGSSTADRKVLVGQFGPIEIAFVVTRAGSDWRVAAEPYFRLMLQ